MTSIVLLNPPSPADAFANREGTASFGALSGSFTYPPHTLATIAASCRNAGLDVIAIDAVAERFDQQSAIEIVRGVNPTLLGVYCSWGTLDADRDNLSALRSAFPRLPIVAIGTGVRLQRRRIAGGGRNARFARRSGTRLRQIGRRFPAASRHRPGAGYCPRPAQQRRPHS